MQRRTLGTREALEGILEDAATPTYPLPSLDFFYNYTILRIRIQEEKRILPDKNCPICDNNLRARNNAQLAVLISHVPTLYILADARGGNTQMILEFRSGHTGTQADRMANCIHLPMREEITLLQCFKSSLPEGFPDIRREIFRSGAGISRRTPAGNNIRVRGRCRRWSMCAASAERKRFHGAASCDTGWAAFP